MKRNPSSGCLVPPAPASNDAPRRCERLPSPPMNWLAVIPTAAIVSAAVTLILRWFDRPRPVLRLEGRMTQRIGDGLSSGAGDGPTETVRVALMNVGDGDAYDVKVFGSKCDPAILIEPGNWGYTSAVLKAGESLILAVGVNADSKKLQDAALIVTWSPRPRRSIRKLLRANFTDLGVAQLLPPGLLPVREIAPKTRSTEDLESLSPRALLYRQEVQKAYGMEDDAPHDST